MFVHDVLSGDTISTPQPAAMLACVLFATISALSECVTVQRHRNQPDIQTDIVEELPPLFIPCNLTDIVTITAPETFSNDTLYYLFNPNNDVTQLNITSTIKQTHDMNALAHEGIKTIESGNSSAILLNTYTVKNVNFGQRFDSKTKDLFGKKSNEFVIGPLAEEDHGNWVLSVYYKRHGSWVEMFQVITIHITEFVPVRCKLPTLKAGGELKLGFAYPLPDIETCELILPTDNQTFDVYLRVERTSLPTCSYVVRNLSVRDAGHWRIIGVGRVVYEGRVSLKIIKNTRTFNRSSKDRGFHAAIRSLASGERTEYLMLNLILSFFMLWLIPKM